MTGVSAAACEAQNTAMLPYVGTVDTARDLDQIELPSATSA